MKREWRYLVAKRVDVERALTEVEQNILQTLLHKVHVWRTTVAGKATLDCVVVESDWPEYEPTWKAIEKRVGVALAGDKP